MVTMSKNPLESCLKIKLLKEDGVFNMTKDSRPQRHEFFCLVIQKLFAY